MDGKNKKDESKDGKPSTPPPTRADDRDVEDGDFATPKRGIEGDDDQPL